MQSFSAITPFVGLSRWNDLLKLPFKSVYSMINHRQSLPDLNVIQGEECQSRQQPNEDQCIEEAAANLQKGIFCVLFPHFFYF